MAGTCSASPATDGREQHTIMMRSLLVRGMLTGLAAAALALVFAWIFGEPQVGHAIAFENAHDKMARMAPAPEIVSRSVQQTWGLATGIGLSASPWADCLPSPSPSPTDGSGTSAPVPPPPRSPPAASWRSRSYRF